MNWTARADLAEAAVAVLMKPDPLEEGMSPPLTGSELLNFNGVARLISELTGLSVEREVISDETYRTLMIQRGTPEVYADLLLTLYTAARVEEFAILDPTLSRLLGRSPTTMQAVLTTYLNKPGEQIF